MDVQRRPLHLLFIAAMAAVFCMIFQAAAVSDNVTHTYKDGTGDVISTVMKRDMTRMVDLFEVEGEVDMDFKQSNQIDIVSFSVRGNDSLISFTIETRGDIGKQEEFTYRIAGYADRNAKETQPYDFMIDVKHHNATYYELRDGRFKAAYNVSSLNISGESLTVTMNTGTFILKSPEDPYILVSIAMLDEGEGGKLFMDHATSSEASDSRSRIDDTTLILLEFVILGFAFITVIIVWNVYMKRKGEENEGGICPRCESRLDPNLDFCPSCGTFVRGPGAKDLRKKPELAPLPEDLEE